MKRSKVYWAVPIAVLVVIGLALAGPIERVKESIEAEGAESLIIECDFGAGELFVHPDDIDQAAILNVTYEPDKVEYLAQYDVRDGVGELFLESEIRGRSVDDLENTWDLTLGTRRPTELFFDIGACEADMDLGGIPITELEMDIGAASGYIEFSEPNPERLREINIDVGASSVEFRRLGNANFEYLSFDGGAASIEVDLRGEFKGESIADFDIGMGSADIVVPDGVAIRIESDDSGWFSSVDFDNLDVDKVRSGVWESPGFEDASDRLVIRLDVGMGSVDIRSR
ncbi:hypothetical protein GF420_10680 [candidate division GN15 bacterium]|nr:hypothetical protein [candidate division GN15 bacterium]